MLAMGFPKVTQCLIMLQQMDGLLRQSDALLLRTAVNKYFIGFETNARQFAIYTKKVQKFNANYPLMIINTDNALARFLCPTISGGTLVGKLNYLSVCREKVSVMKGQALNIVLR